MKNKKLAKATAVCALAGVMLIGGAMAYFTDADTATNEFTVGKVSIDLTEPGWTPPENITPNQEITKDPKITNDGVNSAYVFLQVKVPTKSVVTANEDGTKNAEAVKELFTYQVNEGWTEVGTAADETIGSQTYKVHTYAYGTAKACTAVDKNVTTDALFNSVKFINVIEGEGLEETQLDVIVDAYGIQTTDINGDKTKPVDVWAVLHAQTPTVDSVNKPAAGDSGVGA